MKVASRQTDEGVHVGIIRSLRYGILELAARSNEKRKWRHVCKEVRCRRSAAIWYVQEGNVSPVVRGCAVVVCNEFRTMTR